MRDCAILWRVMAFPTCGRRWRLAIPAPTRCWAVDCIRGYTKCSRATGAPADLPRRWRSGPPAVPCKKPPYKRPPCSGCGRTMRAWNMAGFRPRDCWNWAAIPPGWCSSAPPMRPGPCRRRRTFCRALMSGRCCSKSAARPNASTWSPAAGWRWRRRKAASAWSCCAPAPTRHPAPPSPAGRLAPHRPCRAMIGAARAGARNWSATGWAP